MSGCLHGDAAACSRLGVGRAQKAVDEHGIYDVPNVYRSKVPLLVASVSHPLILCTGSLQNNIVVTLVVHRLFHFPKKATAPIQDEN